ncbi:hypothetical protein HD806DRAFT_307978 [Xylariaceae sp. AK1471]|nr:hypothetical protein HD806DRAFT_307978 [Xylariaceae sp. AK1471]
MASTTSQATKAMKKLSLDPTSSIPSRSKAKPKPKRQAVADSWEDEDSSASEAEAEPPTPSAQSDSQEGVAAPPPTPISPSYGRHGPDGELNNNNAPWIASSSTGGGYGNRDAQDEDRIRRPEKTDAVARRMIASALGVRAPKQTEEQKAYDRSVREKERKRREEEREAERRRQEEAERVKAAMWDD